MQQHWCTNSHPVLIPGAKVDLFPWASADFGEIVHGWLIIYFFSPVTSVPWGECERVEAAVDSAFTPNQVDFKGNAGVSWPTVAELRLMILQTPRTKHGEQNKLKRFFNLTFNSHSFVFFQLF